MLGEFITNDQVQEAFTFLHTKAEEAARARATRMYIEEFRKVLKSRCMKKYEGSMQAKEMMAYDDEEYTTFLRGAYIEAIAKDEHFRWMKSASEVTLESWRTQESTLRATTKTG